MLGQRDTEKLVSVGISWYQLVSVGISVGISWYQLVSVWSVWYQLAKIGGTLKWSSNVKERSTRLKHVSDHRQYFCAKKNPCSIQLSPPFFPNPVSSWRHERVKGLSTGRVFSYPILSYPIILCHRTYIHTSTGRIFGLWFSYFHTTCNGSSAPPSQPQPIHATPSATTNSRLCLHLHRHCHRCCRCRCRCRNLHHRRCRHRHRLTAAVAFAATFSSLYFS